MQRHNRKLAAIAMVASAALAVAPAASAKSAAYQGKFSGTANVQYSDSGATISSVNGTGGAAGLTKLAGKNGTATGSGSCGFFSGVATLSGAKGKVTLNVKNSSKACGDTTFTVTGTATAVGASGKYKGTKGAVTFSGTENKATGAFTVTIKGTV
jgi:hypothetical protein